MSKTKNNFNFNIQSFSGDPSTIKFFFLQLEDYIRINALSEEQSIATFRSLLSGNALKYFIEESSLTNLKTLKELKEKFIEFFKAEDTPSIFALNEIMLMPNETVRSLAHRINTTFTKVYPAITDPVAVDTLKFTHLMNALPHNIKLDLLRENINHYDVAVTRAQELQNINVSLNSQVNTHKMVDLNQEINSLKEQINVLVNKNNGKESETSRRNFNRHRNRPYNNNRNKYNNNNNRFCQFCGRYGHVMKFCEEFMQISQPNQTRNRGYGRRRTYYNKNSYSRKFPNPNATPFNPNLN